MCIILYLQEKSSFSVICITKFTMYPTRVLLQKSETGNGEGRKVLFLREQEKFSLCF